VGQHGLVALFEVAGPRAAEVQRHRGGEHPVAASGQELQRVPVISGEGAGIEVERADVVDAYVQAAEVPAPARLRLHGRELAGDHLRGPRAVHGHPGVGEPQPARRPQRPRLQRDAPLQLPAAVGDRVAERDHAEAAVHGGGS
jgi:hypothetical protein